MMGASWLPNWLDGMPHTFFPVLISNGRGCSVLVCPGQLKLLDRQVGTLVTCKSNLKFASCKNGEGVLGWRVIRNKKLCSLVSFGGEWKLGNK